MKKNLGKIRKVVKTLILHINNSKKSLQISEKNSSKKRVT